MTHDDASLIKMLKEGWRGDTATDLMREAADRIQALSAARERVRDVFPGATDPCAPRTCAPRTCTHVDCEVINALTGSAVQDHLDGSE